MANNNESLNAALARSLRTGKEYEHLLPKSTCEKLYVGDGDTSFSIDQMEDVILDYAWQTEKLAAVLQKKAIAQTVRTIHDFLFDHLQYYADGDDQMVRSPACSWHTRYEGIDCKSYSIFASCLLLNMGITHYIRKVVYPGDDPNHFSHVYVVVPVDQSTGNLNKGYLVIDGTIPTPFEGVFINKSDLKMSGMKHYRLNAPKGRIGRQPGLNGINLSAISSLFKTGKLTSILSGLSCLSFTGTDHSSLDANGFKVYVANIDKYLADWNLRLNTAVQNDQTAVMSSCVAEFFAMSKMLYLASDGNRKKTSWNGCTGARIDAATKIYKFLRDVASPLLQAWVDDNFDKTGTSGIYTATSEGVETKYSFRHLNVSPPIVISQAIVQYKPKLTQSIPAFEITPYVTDKTNAGQPVDTSTFLDSLVNIVQSFTPPASSGSGSTGGSGNGSSPTDGGYYLDGDDEPKKESSTAGFGWVVGALVVAAGYGITKMKDKPATARKQTANRKPTTKK